MRREVFVFSFTLGLVPGKRLGIRIYAHRRRKFERILSAARKSKFDKVSRPPLLRWSSVRDKYSASSVRQLRTLISRSNRHQPEIAGGWIRRLPHFHRGRL